MRAFCGGVQKDAGGNWHNGETITPYVCPILSYHTSGIDIRIDDSHDRTRPPRQNCRTPYQASRPGQGRPRPLSPGWSIWPSDFQSNSLPPYSCCSKAQKGRYHQAQSLRTSSLLTLRSYY